MAAKKKATARMVAPDASPKKKGQVKDTSDAEDAEEDDEDIVDNLDGISDADLAAPPPPRSCTLVGRSNSLASPSKSKKARLEANGESPVSMDVIMLIVSKTYKIVQEMQTTVCAIRDKTQKNTRDLVDLTQLFNRVNELATAAETTASAVSVKDEFKGKYAALNIDDKIVTKFVANALSFITMWPKVEMAVWLPHKLEAFGKDVAAHSELDQVPNFYFMSCV